MVSRLEIEGERDRVEVGVLGTLEPVLEMEMAAEEAAGLV
jgi:hypothetical protein